jgi:hypothetical protein
LFDAAEGASRSLPGFVSGHAFRDRLVFEQLKMGMDLARERRLGGARAEE